MIVPVYNVAAYLPACLDSLLGQTLEDLEVVAVDDGSTDACPRILAEYAARDRRVRVVRQENAGQGAARNHGVTLARGEFITFVDSDDTIPPRAFAHMIRVLRASGSDFCVGKTRRMTHGQFQPLGWNRVAHDRDRIGITIDEHPLALRDIIAGNRVIRRDFWVDRVPPFEPGIAYEDHVPMLMAYVRARRFDLLAQPTYNWRIREDNTSTGQQKTDIANLRDRIAVKAQAHELLLAEASPTTYDAWVARCIASDFPPYAIASFGASDEYRALLAETYRTLLERATPRTLTTVSPTQKITAWLIARDRWREAEQAHAWLTDAETRRPTVVVDDGIALARPAHLALDDVPDELWRIAEQDVRARAALRGLRLSPSLLELSVVAWMHRVDDPGAPPTATAELVAEQTGERHPLDVVVDEDADARVWAADPVTDARPGVLRLSVDPRALAPGRWAVELTVSQAGLCRTTGVTGRVTGALPRQLPTLEAPGLRITPRLATGEPLTLQLEAQGSGAAPATSRVLGIAVADGVLAVEQEGAGATALSGPTRVPAEPGARFALRGADGLAVPSGDYALVDGPERVDDRLAGRLPLTRVDALARVGLAVDAEGRPRVSVAPPLDDDERNPALRSRRRATYLDTPAPLRTHDVLLISDDGRSATGDPAAIDAELARSRPGLRRIWAVRDLSVAVPAGAERVVVDSDAWWHHLATARWIVADESPGPWFGRRPEQTTVLTHRGRPVKSLGRERWRLRGYSADRLDRTSAGLTAAWSALLAPDDDAAALYRQGLGYAGHVLATGAPRTDRLVRAVRDGERDAIRAGLLARWGVDPDRTVILVAPTYRDATPRLGSGRRHLVSAGTLPPLDLAALAARTGAVVALRAHPLDADAARRAAVGPDVVNLTGHPDVVDVLLAADAAVLDYSALRFDWALTGRPAVFFAPDRDAYFARRPPLVPYDETTPGPVVATEAEVVAALRDVPALTRRTAEQRAAFNARFNASNDGAAAARVVAALFSA